MLFYVVGGTMALLGLVNMVLQIVSFFRRSPPIEQVISALAGEFNKQLNDRVLIRDFNACEARHTGQLREAQTRFTAEIQAMEGRIDRRLDGLHGSLVELRRTSIQATLDVMKDLGYVQGSKADKGEG
jgi:hypothetical protein